MQAGAGSREETGPAPLAEVTARGNRSTWLRGARRAHPGSARPTLRWMRGRRTQGRSLNGRTSCAGGPLPFAPLRSTLLPWGYSEEGGFLQRDLLPDRSGRWPHPTPSLGRGRAAPLTHLQARQVGVELREAVQHHRAAAGAAHLQAHGVPHAAAPPGARKQRLGPARGPGRLGPHALHHGRLAAARAAGRAAGPGAARAAEAPAAPRCCALCPPPGR